MADMSVASCLRPLSATGGVTVRRRKQPVFVKGVMVENEPVEMQIAGHVQQAMPSSLMFLPEGVRNNDYIWVYTEVPLRATDVKSQQLSDFVEWNERDYEVLKLEDWLSAGGSNGGFHRALCARVGQ